MTSAYPVTLDTLIGQVQARAVELGEIPSRNRIKTEFKVGSPKAAAVLQALNEAGFDPARSDAIEPRRLHAVPSGDGTPDGRTVPDEPAVADVVQPVSDVAPEPADVVPATGETAVSETVPVEVTTAVDPGPATTEADSAEASTPPAQKPQARHRRTHMVPLLVIAASAFVAIWGGWVGLGELTGFGEVALLPGIADGFTIDSAITLPLGMEAYAAFALGVWLTVRADRPRRFAKWSAISALTLGGLGQVAYHLMTAAGVTTAPWPITTFVSCLPVAVLGSAAALLHLLRDNARTSAAESPVEV